MSARPPQEAAPPAPPAPDPPERGDEPPVRGGLLWAAAVLAAAIPLLAAAWVVAEVQGGERPPFLAEPGPAGPVPPTRAACDGTVRLAGSGSNLALTRALVDAWRRAPAPDGPPAGNSPPRAVVHDSIGSTGGVRAVRDAVVDLGLASRPLTPAETAAGLRAQPYARVPVVLAAHPDVPAEDLRPADIVALYAGRRRTWSDGQPIVVLQREHGDSSHRAVDAVVPGFQAANEAAWRSGRWRVLYSDRAMLNALANTPGAVGLSDAATVATADVPLRLLRVDGIAPDAAALRAGRWPFSKDLSFVHAGPPCPATAAFLAFVAGPGGQEVTRDLGALPLADPPP